MPWDEPYEPQYDFSEKFRGKSTRELLDLLKPAKAQLREFFDEGDGRNQTPRNEWPAAPAFWVTKDALEALEDAFAKEDEQALVEVFRERATEVPREDPDIATTLYGEFLGLLEANGVPVTEGRPSPYGVIYVITRRETRRIEKPLAEFQKIATDELLSDAFPHLILYDGEPQVVRKGIEHFARAINIPRAFHALLLIGR